MKTKLQCELINKNNILTPVFEIPEGKRVKNWVLLNDNEVEVELIDIDYFELNYSIIEENNIRKVKITGITDNSINGSYDLLINDNKTSVLVENGMFNYEFEIENKQYVIKLDNNKSNILFI